MKKFSTLALGLLLGGLGLSANAAYTDIEPTATPPNNSSLSYTEMGYMINIFSCPMIYWGEIEETSASLSLNPESEYVNGKTIKCKVLIDEEYFMDVDAGLWHIYLEFAMDPVWSKITEQYSEDIYFQIVVPEGCLYVGDNGDLNNEYTLTYFILGEGGGSSTPTYEYLPDPSFDLVDNELLFVCWNTQIYPMDDKEGTTVQGLLTAPNQNPEPVTLNITSWGNGEEGQTATYNDNALMLNLAPYIEIYGYGNYSLRIWEETVNDGESAVNSEVTWSAIIEQPVILPDEIIDYVYFSINTKEITLLYDYDVEINPYCEAEIAVYDPIGDGFARPTADDITIAGGQVTINLAPYNLEDGVTYYYEIPAGFFIIGEDYINDFIEGEFNKTSGINGIGSEFENAAIYNLQGVRVDRSNLVKGGIYIINGKKVAVK